MSKTTSDVGLLTFRELDGVPGLVEMAPTYLQEIPSDKNTSRELVPLSQ